MTDPKFLLSIVTILVVAALTAFGKLSGDAFIALITGLILPSPLDKVKIPVTTSTPTIPSLPITPA